MLFDAIVQGGGESFDQLYERCTAALQRIAKKHKGSHCLI